MAGYGDVVSGLMNMFGGRKSPSGALPNTLAGGGGKPMGPEFNMAGGDTLGTPPATPRQHLSGEPTLGNGSEMVPNTNPGMNIYGNFWAWLASQGYTEQQITEIRMNPQMMAYLKQMWEEWKAQRVQDSRSEPIGSSSSPGGGGGAYAPTGSGAVKKRQSGTLPGGYWRG